MKIDILGAAWTIVEKLEAEDARLEGCDGYCDWTTHEIVVEREMIGNLGDMAFYIRKVKRHVIVLFVEQVNKDLHGKDKLRAAMEALSKRLAEKKIMISEAEMEILIEAAVGEFNEAFKRPALDAATADAVRRTTKTD